MKNRLRDIKNRSQSIQLLYVEDDANARATTLEMLKNFFLETHITVARDGKEGLERFEEGEFDLILTDINMPRLSGIEMLKKMRKSEKKFAAIILSAYNETDYFLDAIKLNVDGFMIKPLKYEQFLDVLDSVLKKISAEKRDREYHLFLEQEIESRTKEMRRKLLYDELTGLWSRYSFFEDLKETRLPMLFMIDINKFRIINEIYGTDAGSLVLKEFAKFLLEFATPKGYKTYRLASDEFILMEDAKEIDPQKHEEELASFFKALDSFSVKISDDDTISLEVSIGIASVSTNPFESVKIALEYAKEHKQHFACYSKAMDKRLEEQNALEWKNRIKTAINTQNIVTVYQGIVDKHEETIQYEALMRLRDSQQEELITPFYFLDIAIKTGLYEPLSSHVIFEALNKIKEARVCMSINFTYDDIQNRSFIDAVEDFIVQNPFVGALVVFEITESQSIENYTKVKDFIYRFRKYGVRIAIDDFGSGFSNFEYILEIEPDYLKIDGSLIKNIDTDEKSLVLVRAIVQFSHELGIKTIAEFVHSKTIFDILKALNVDEYQGFYFHKPAPFPQKKEK